MKKFVFRLEKVLHFRSLIKDEKKRELGKWLSLLYEATSRLEKLREAQLANVISSERVLHVEEVVMQALYAERLKAEIEAQSERIAELEIEVERARNEYIEASREVEVLEKLKARKKEEYIHEMDLFEGKELDEFGIQRSGKQYF